MISESKLESATTKEEKEATSSIPEMQPEKPLSKLDKAKLMRLKRQLTLQNELNSAASEDENLAIEQVFLFYFRLKVIARLKNILFFI